LPLCYATTPATLILMKIEQIDLYHISQQLVSPFRTSFGVQEQRDCLLLALHSEG
jgi:hypothetical protein